MRIWARGFFLFSVISGLWMAYKFSAVVPDVQDSLEQMEEIGDEEDVNEASLESKDPSCLSCGQSDDGQNFTPPRTVTVQGRVFPYNPKNIYWINGEKVFYVDRSREWYREKDVTGQKVETRTKIKGKSKSSELEMDSLLGAYSPQNMDKTMRTLKKTQQEMSKRNAYLKELMNE